MNKYIEIIIGLLLLNLGLKAQCLVNYKQAMAELDGVYLHHQEMDNRLASNVSFVCNGGVVYYLYLLNANHDLSAYHLIEEGNSNSKIVKVDSETGFVKFIFKADKAEIVNLKLLVDTDEKACVLLAIFIGEDYNELTQKYAQTKAMVPDDMVKVGDNLFFGKYEVSNTQWMEYVHWCKQVYGKESPMYLSALPDSNWYTKGVLNEELTAKYWNHSAYKGMPAYGIRYKQVLSYLKWFNTIENNKLYAQIWHQPYFLFENYIEVPKVYEYRLPCKSEWETVANIDYAGNLSGEIHKYARLHNSNGLIMAKLEELKPNSLGIYNLIGNVWEMVSEGGIAKGGSLYSYADKVRVASDFIFEGQSHEVGFRLVCEKDKEAQKLIEQMEEKRIKIIDYAKDKSDNPPGTVKVGNSLFFDTQEIRNIDWGEYVYWVKQKYGKESEEYYAVLPDTMVWQTEIAYDPLVEYYYSHAAFHNYPVVGISYDQAIAFCQWRSDRVNELNYYKTNKIKPVIGMKIPKEAEIYRYRLPTKQEWESMARIGYSERTLKAMAKLDQEGGAYYNLKSINPLSAFDGGVRGQLNDNAEITAPVNNYYANEIGLYNLIGNVAEMVNEKGIAKGGSWLNTRVESGIDRDLKYDKASCWLGFRCICEKIK